MKLIKLSIGRRNWGINSGTYSGYAEFDNELGRISLRLDEEMCQKIFKVCADGVLQISKAAAEEMRLSVIECIRE